MTTRRLMMLVGAVACVVAGCALLVTSALRAMKARRDLVSELSSTLGRVRSLDRVVQQVRVERGEATPAVTLLNEAVKTARTVREAALLEQSRGCFADGGCPDTVTTLELAQREGEAPVTERWAEVDDAEKDTRVRFPAGLGLALVGLVLAALSGAGAPSRAPPAAAPPTAPVQDHALEEMLRTRLEALYQANSRLDEASRFSAFGELAAALSHGLKTPLAGLLASVQLAQLKLGEGHAANAELDEVVRLTEGLSEQLHRFLRAAGQAGPTPRRLQVAEVLAGLATGSAAAEATRRGVRYVVRESPPGLVVEADAALLEMALRNLVENALVAVKPGQLVEVSAAPCPAPERVGLEGTAPAPGTAFVALVVEDEGPGLPAATKRAEPGVTTRAHGSGLGLAIARRVAERHQGTLKVEDRPGGGARVSLILPERGAAV